MARANHTNWLIELPKLQPGHGMVLYPRGPLDVEKVEAAMKVQGYNMRHYRVGSHGEEIHIRRWNNVAGTRPQKEQPEHTKKQE